MARTKWRTWNEIEAEAKAAGRLDEAAVAQHRHGLQQAQRVYRLREIRKARGLSQAEVARNMGVSQRRVSAIERGEFGHTQLGTIGSYVSAISRQKGRVEVLAEVDDEQLVIG